MHGGMAEGGPGGEQPSRLPLLQLQGGEGGRVHGGMAERSSHCASATVGGEWHGVVEGAGEDAFTGRALRQPQASATCGAECMEWGAHAQLGGRKRERIQAS